MNDKPNFAEKIKALRNFDSAPPSWRAEVKVRVLRNYTLENVGPLLRYSCAQASINAKVTFADYDTFEQEILDPASDTNAGAHDLILLSLWLDGLMPSADAHDFFPDEVFRRVEALVESLLARTSGLVVLTNFLVPFFAIGGPRVGNGPGTLAAQVDILNARIAAYAAAKNRICVLDLVRIAGALGQSRAFDLRFWYSYHAPFQNAVLELLADELAAMLVAVKGGTKKVLALDCDNTLWGGVIGEDGMDGILLDAGSSPGTVYRDFHRQLLQLKARGVILVLCSKNNEEDALAVFDRHPQSLLKRSDFAAWQINWEDKTTNLRRLAASLNVGLDSLVFIDDSQLECEQVRRSLPEVTVLPVPSPIHQLPLLLRDFHGFDRVAHSDEDRTRTKMYQEEFLRDHSRQQYADLDEFLRSLELAAEIREPRDAEVGRVAQLTQKTNQFNLTTQRYGEGDIERMRRSADHAVLAMAVRDRFGDYGLTGLAILSAAGAEVSIDTLLMSCRVLGRRLEFGLLGRCIEEARRRFPHARYLRGKFVPTAKNNQVRDLLPRAGFSPAGPDGDEFVFDLTAAFALVPGHVRFVETSEPAYAS